MNEDTFQYYMPDEEYKTFNGDEDINEYIEDEIDEDEPSELNFD